MAQHDVPIDALTASETLLPGHWLSEAAQAAFFEEVLERAVDAESRTGAIVRHLELADTIVELAFAGDRLASRFMPALAHLTVPPDRPPDVTFHIWDSASTGVEMIPPPCKRDCFTDRGDIWGMASERIKSAFHWSECSVNLMDLERQRAVYWVHSDEGLPYWTTASPLRTLFHWWIEHRGGQLLHAAAIGSDDGALLITGRGGVGKSSTAVACLAAGMKYVADDYLVVRLDPSPRVFSLYSTAKLDPRQMTQFPGLQPSVAGEQFRGGEKAVIQLFPRFATQVVRSLPLNAIATPRYTPQAGTVFTVTPRILLERAAAFTTMSQLPHAGRRLHHFIQRMVAELPGLEIALGNDLSRIPDAVQGLLRSTSEDFRRLGQHQGSRAARIARPLITIIIPVYNGAAFLEEAIANILAQNYGALEIIIVDDGSTDDTAEVVRRLPVDVRYFRQENSGAAAARNRGIKDASGELVAFLDVDDLWPEGQLKVLADRMTEDPAVDVLHGRAQVTRYTPAGGPGEYIGNPAESFPWYIGAGLYRRRAFEKVGLFDRELKFGEDTDWFHRATELGIRIVRLEEVTLFVRRHGANATRGKSLVELNMLRVVKKALDRRSAGSRAEASM